MDELQPIDGKLVEPAAPISNNADHVRAQNVVQVGVVHGGLHITAEPARRGQTALNVSVTSRQLESTTYGYEDVRGHPDIEVHVLVEAFTPQAVVLRRLRPVFVREVALEYWSNAMMLPRREFRVGLDLPARRFDADVPGQALRLDRTCADGGAEFPFHVTASAPEYFVIWPTLRGARSPVEWRLELDWSCLGQDGTVTIDHGGRPFLSDGGVIRMADLDLEGR
ncbi:hypothetical protein [Lentzea aerocolonigenes]|uniref:hypothetical protein n=1 Tax=Lentzea aerocolonigenes TaxID=68170 RepID=UPI0018C881CD|nr:hypothetical protein [Lentzea aerocolonigenes]